MGGGDLLLVCDKDLHIHLSGSKIIHPFISRLFFCIVELVGDQQVLNLIDQFYNVIKHKKIL